MGSDASAWMARVELIRAFWRRRCVLASHVNGKIFREAVSASVATLLQGRLSFVSATVDYLLRDLVYAPHVVPNQVYSPKGIFALLQMGFQVLVLVHKAPYAARYSIPFGMCRQM